MPAFKFHSTKYQHEKLTRRERPRETAQHNCLVATVITSVSGQHSLYPGGFLPSVEPRRRLYLISMPALLVLLWFGHAARRADDELIKDLLLPTPLRTWPRRIGGQLETWETTIKADLEPLSGPRVTTQ